jgi:hypothetical protein
LASLTPLEILDISRILRILDISITQMISGFAFLFFVAKRKKIYIPGLENNKHLGLIPDIFAYLRRCLLISNPGI